MPLPSAGGIALLQLLTLLEPYPLAEWGLNSSRTMQVMSQSMNLAFADRIYLGDADFIKDPVTQLLDKNYLDERRKLINPNQDVPSSEIKPGLHTVNSNMPVESPQTSHLSVVDKDRNMVANTFSINYSLGTAIVVPGTGIVLNNEMDDFAAETNASNAYGLVGSVANLIVPEKRPLSSMTPTLVFDAKGNPVMTTGAIGGSRIITIILQVILNTLEHELDIATATNAPRFHSQWLPDEVSIEEGFSNDTISKIVQLGFNAQLRPRIGAGHSIVIEDNKLYGAADPRIATSKAAGY
jgi:gamma-glutamyltranspeptidase/glutathione hydrolase